MLVGHGRKFLSVLVTKSRDAEAVLAAANADLPHYKQIRTYRKVDPFTIEEGLLTANGKLKRDAILRRYAAEIEEMYR
jgi:long-chain acyl-CoA synthetase